VNKFQHCVIAGVQPLAVSVISWLLLRVRASAGWLPWRHASVAVRSAHAVADQKKVLSNGLRQYAISGATKHIKQMRMIMQYGDHTSRRMHVNRD